ncbi:MAG: PEP/pyruvate-binding domain-containing protein [Armatimonadetes bacterium]|nr:PEP/pyruvate-binding domain-containing protein [Armatimonadota bacterium]MDW8153524.1 PEP/pyruvate-binding domain-containing protein [Armatimonadota bacterium]
MMGEIPITLEFSRVGLAERSLVGGKVASLGELLRHGCRVPPGFAVTSLGYRRFLEANGLEDRLRQALASVVPHDLESIERASQQITGMFLESRIPPEVQGAIERGYEDLGIRTGQSDPPVAVRSSALAEDSEQASFAGQQETYLWVRGTEQVLDSVRRCWASAFTPRALSYRLTQGVSLDDGVAVGVQQMVHPRAAGVLFTLSPRTGDRSLIVVEGSWGPGVAVVSGEVTPDEFTINKVTLEIVHRKISPKTVQFAPSGHEGLLVKVPVPEDLQTKPCLSDAEAVELARLARHLEQVYGFPLDIEWAVAENEEFPHNLYLLQSRPETVWSRRPRSSIAANFKDPLSYVVQTLAGKALSR